MDLIFPEHPTLNQTFQSPLGTPIWRWDGVRWKTLKTSVEGGFPEPPSDGMTYGRRNGDWNALLPLSGGMLNGALTAPSITATNTISASHLRTTQGGQSDWAYHWNGADIHIAAIGQTGWMRVTTENRIWEIARHVMANENPSVNNFVNSMRMPHAGDTRCQGECITHAVVSGYEYFYTARFRYIQFHRPAHGWATAWYA